MWVLLSHCHGLLRDVDNALGTAPICCRIYFAMTPNLCFPPPSTPDAEYPLYANYPRANCRLHSLSMGCEQFAAQSTLGLLAARTSYGAESALLLNLYKVGKFQFQHADNSRVVDIQHDAEYPLHANYPRARSQLRGGLAPLLNLHKVGVNFNFMQMCTKRIHAVTNQQTGGGRWAVGGGRDVDPSEPFCCLPPALITFLIMFCFYLWSNGNGR